MTALLDNWKRAGTRVKIHARVTLPFPECELTEVGLDAISVRHDDREYWLPYSAITWIEEV